MKARKLFIEPEYLIVSIIFIKNAHWLTRAVIGDNLSMPRDATRRLLPEVRQHSPAFFLKDYIILDYTYNLS